MALAALIVFAVFALVAGGARVVIQRRRTGDTGIRQFRPVPGSLQWWAHWGFVVGGLVTGLGAPLADLAGLAPVPLVDRPAVTATGAVIAVVGVAATFAAQLAMGASWRIGVDDTERTRLVTTGVFACVRNPIFTAMLATFAGLALMVPNPVAIIGYALLLAGVQAQVRAVEEPYLQQVHGHAYTAYTAQVGRFVPGVGRRRQPQR
ncbi:methyltransferase family protein [Nocardia cyriacigeorgica]|uniref:methyltransferase family protein n=1 Tax=Nocardia cyriacigeorgica TaxID=135487 RepID=UPI0018956C93|nr:isoprenylcysteine carboxylmethyltransferase family protein [Nocardia cyriacigeorgica]MBF6439582.1 isoprenylcysteine carboxylmethyltransferase family protein [Nocardia cyriacigeorgica]